ncbi:hypothetical protein [Pseudoalteromonas sp. PB2-1]|uniref:hypothetical protein n=1 Tax=Pseudoalteromonas sp. PB2-1 TaxID=2907242 RepID=UPI00386A4E2B
MKPTYLPKSYLLNIIFFCAVIIVFFITFMSHKIPLYFSWGQNFEDLLFRLSFSIIPSYLFYFIVVHLKSNKDKKNLRPLVIGCSNGISNKYRNLFDAFHQNDSKLQYERTIQFHTDETLSNITEEYLSKTLSKIKVNSNSPYMIFGQGRYMNWVEFITFTCNEIERDINSLMLISSHLDSEHISILYKIKSSELMQAIDGYNFKDMLMPNDSLYILHIHLYEFHLALNKLELYISENK